MKTPKVLVYTDLEAQDAEKTRVWIALKLKISDECVVTQKLDKFNGPIPEDVDLAVCVTELLDNRTNHFKLSPAQADAISTQQDKIFMVCRGPGNKDVGINIRTIPVQINGRDNRIEIKFHMSYLDSHSSNFLPEDPNDQKYTKSPELSFLASFNSKTINEMKKAFKANIDKKNLAGAPGEGPESGKGASGGEPGAGVNPAGGQGTPGEKAADEPVPGPSISARDSDTAVVSPTTISSSTPEEKKDGWQRPVAIASAGVGSVIIGGGSAAGLAQIEGVTSIMASSGMSSGAVDAAFGVGGTLIAVVVFSLSYAAINKFMTPKNYGVVRGG